MLGSYTQRDFGVCGFETPDICASFNMGPPEVTLTKCSTCKLSNSVVYSVRKITGKNTN